MGAVNGGQLQGELGFWVRVAFLCATGTGGMCATGGKEMVCAMAVAPGFSCGRSQPSGSRKCVANDVSSVEVRKGAWGAEHWQCTIA